MTATHALGWALVHSLWQCALAAVALALLLAIVPARSARIRYALATATLVLTLALPLTTAVRVGEASPATPGNGLATSAVASRPASDATPAAQAASPEGAMVAQETPRGYAPTTPAIAALRLASRSRKALEPVLPWIVALWLAGVLVLSARLAWGWIARRRALLCGGPARHGAPPRRGPDARAHGGGRLPDGPGAATRGARARGDLSTLDRRRDRRDARGGDRRRLPPG